MRGPGLADYRRHLCFFFNPVEQIRSTSESQHLVRTPPALLLCGRHSSLSPSVVCLISFLFSCSPPTHGPPADHRHHQLRPSSSAVHLPALPRVTPARANTGCHRPPAIGRSSFPSRPFAPVSAHPPHTTPRPPFCSASRSPRPILSLWCCLRQIITLSGGPAEPAAAAGAAAAAAGAAAAAPSTPAAAATFGPAVGLRSSSSSSSSSSS